MIQADLDAIAASIEKTHTFSFGYPKRIEVNPSQPHAAAWQRFFSWQYDLICKKLARPNSPTLFDAPHTT